MPKLVVSLLALLLLAIPGSLRPAAASDAQVLKIGTLAPRNSSFMREFARLEKRVRAATSGGVKFRLYASGVAGDETDMLRKMRAGQLDAAMITSDGLGQLLPDVNVLRAPGVVTSYKQLEAVQTVMLPEFDKSFEERGFKLITWGEAGEYRYFSRRPVHTPADIRTMRPWLWPASPVMKETWRAIGANPVPLGMGEVFGALQTRMVDLVESTAVAYLALQWHMTDLAHVTEESSGVLVGAWVMNSSAFDRLKPEWRETLIELARSGDRAARQQARKADRGAYQALVKRGYQPSRFDAEARTQMAAIHAQVRKRMAGRIYPVALLERVQTIADKFR